MILALAQVLLLNAYRAPQYCHTTISTSNRYEPLVTLDLDHYVASPPYRDQMSHTSENPTKKTSKESQK